MLIRLGLCVLFSLCNCVTDWKSGKIRNKVVIPFAAAGLLSQLIGGGWYGLLNAFGAAAMALVLLPLFALRMLGAGDIKAFMAIGAMVGFPAAVYIMAYSFLGAGVIAVALLLVRKNGRQRAVRFWQYCKDCFRACSFRSYDGIDGSGVFRFSFGILAGTAAYMAQYIIQ